MPGIETSTAWKTLAAHAERMKRTHLRDLLGDAARNSALSIKANGILFDFSRQNVNIEVGEKSPMVRISFAIECLESRLSIRLCGDLNVPCLA